MINVEQKVESNLEKVGLGKSLAWASRSLGTASAFTIISFLSIYCTDTLGLPISLVGGILLVSKIFDGVTDLIAGYIVDNTQTRFGKGRPYEFAIIGMWISTVLLFSTPESFSLPVKAAWVFVMYIFVQSIFGTLGAASETPYMMRAFPNTQAMGKVSSLVAIFSAMGGIVVSVLFPVLMASIAINGAGWTRLLLIFAIPLSLIGFMRFIFVKEIYPQVDDDNQERVKVVDMLKMLKENGYVWVLAVIFLLKGLVANLGMGTYYFKYIVGNVALLGVLSIASLLGIVVMILVPALLKKFTISEIIIGCTLFAILGYTINWFAKDNITLLIIGAAFTALPIIPISSFLNMMAMDVAVYNVYKGGKSMEATVAAMPNFLNKIGGGVGAGLMGIILGAIGYDGALADQSTAVVNTIRAGNSLIPGFMFMLLLLVMIRFNKLEKQIPFMKEEIAKREADKAMEQTR